MVQNSLRVAWSNFAPAGQCDQLAAGGGERGDHLDLLGRRRAGVGHGQLVLVGLAGEPAGLPFELDGQLGLGHVDGPGDPLVLDDRVDVGAPDVDHAVLLAAGHGVDDQGFELDALAGADLADGLLDDVVVAEPEAGAELGLDDHVPRRAGARVVDGDLEGDLVPLQDPAGRGGRLDLELGLLDGRVGPRAGLGGDGRGVLARLGRDGDDLEDDHPLAVGGEHRLLPVVERLVDRVGRGLGRARLELEAVGKLVDDRDARGVDVALVVTTSLTVDSLPRLMTGLAWTSTVSWTRCLPRLSRSGDRTNGSGSAPAADPVSRLDRLAGPSRPGSGPLSSASAGITRSSRGGGRPRPEVEPGRRVEAPSSRAARRPGAARGRRDRASGAEPAPGTSSPLTFALGTWAGLVDAHPPTAISAAIARSAAGPAEPARWARRRSGVESNRPIMETVPSLGATSAHRPRFTPEGGTRGRDFGAFAGLDSRSRPIEEGQFPPRSARPAVRRSPRAARPGRPARPGPRPSPGTTSPAAWRIAGSWPASSVIAPARSTRPSSRSITSRYPTPCAATRARGRGADCKPRTSSTRPSANIASTRRSIRSSSSARGRSRA